MARVVPSLAVRTIEAAFPSLADGTSSDTYLEQSHAPSVALILDVVDQIPTDLRPTNATDLTTFVAACGAMRGALLSWSGGGHPAHAATLRSSPVFGGKHPIAALVLVLRDCPDEAANSEITALAAINDLAAREDIRIDMANAHRALGNGEFKAATVLAGSVIEALLLWRIQQKSDAEIDAALAVVSVTLKAAGKKTPDKRGIEYWHLSDFIGVARQLGILDDLESKGAELAGEFRNLIHPGRVLRTGSRCDQATALTALGAMERIASAI